MQNTAKNTGKYDDFTSDQFVALITKLEQKIGVLNAMLFSSKKERVKTDPIGMSLLFDEVEAAKTEAKEKTDAQDDKVIEIGAHTRKSRGKRAPLPKNLPRERQEFDLDEKDKICSTHGVAKVRIGEDITEKLVVIPAQLKVVEQVTFTYKCPCCEELGEPSIVKSAKDPDPIPKSFASAELLSYIATAKYEDALPLARQEKIFARYGIEMSRTTMARWMIELGELTQPLINLMQETLLEGPVLQCDETRVQVLDEPNRTPEQQSYMWVLTRQYNGPLVFFSYFDNRGKKAAQNLLEGFSGILVSDGLKTYDSLAKIAGFDQAGCMAHVRRKFFHAEKEEKRLSKKGTSASVALSFIRGLYLIERELSGKPPDQIKEERQKRSLPILEKFRNWMDEEQKRSLPQSLLGKAIHYALDQWPKLIKFCEHGLVPIDNNYTEAHIRPFVIGRNNWVFSATPAGAHASASLYSLIETAKANHLNAYDYLCMIFKELPKAQTVDDYERLLPYNAAKHFTIAEYRPS